jgi:hypothetical protein
MAVSTLVARGLDVLRHPITEAAEAGKAAAD